jgi:hypothetical protein
MTLAEALDRIQSLGDEDIVFAVRPWTLGTEAAIGLLDDEYGVPQAYKDRKLEYFLEASLAKELLADFHDRGFTKDQRRDFLVYYAEHDAFPSWADG